MVTVWGNCLQSVKLSCGVGAVVVTISQEYERHFLGSEDL